ncbi:hypothetical protein TNCV_4976521 [Trichonephila clavipes]|nr:hypothetical protein TNCV_4976521 [Trichonephila clavipes]
MWKRPYLAGYTWRGATTEEHVLRQEVRITRSNMPYHSKDRAEGTVKPYLAGYSGATTEEHVLRQEVRAGHITRSNMPYHSKDRAEGTVKPYLAGYTWRGATTEEHVLRQEVRAGHITRSNMPYHSKDRAEGTVKPYLAGYTWRGATTEEHVLRQEVRAGHITRSNMPYHSKDRAEGTVKRGGGSHQAKTLQGVLRELEICNVEKALSCWLHGAAQRRRNTCCVKKFGQDILQDQICPIIQKTEQKVRSTCNYGICDSESPQPRALVS